jgi:hypothetical protein
LFGGVIGQGLCGFDLVIMHYALSIWQGKFENVNNFGVTIGSIKGENA